MEKKLSAGLVVAWQIAAQEAAAARCRYIEKEHMLIGACSLEKVVKLIQEQKGPAPEILGELQMEQKDLDLVLGYFDLDATSFRRLIRKMTGQGDYQTTEKVIHRSEECKKVFAEAEKLSTSNTVSILHFIAALMENPGITITHALGQKGVRPSDIHQFALNIVKPPVSSIPQRPSPQIPSPREEKQKVKTKIFIVHGRNLAPALTLRSHLKELGLNAEMFLDTKKASASKTIIEILEQIKNEAAYAFIIVTPDDVGSLREDFNKCKEALFEKNKIAHSDVRSFTEMLNTRARQNVVFEYGLFMGALGRDRTCCLLQADTKERPSDLSGLLFEEFNKDISETFLDIEAKLRDPKIGLIETSAKADKNS